MARIESGKYPRVFPDCRVGERIVIMRDRTGLTPYGFRWCDEHRAWIKDCSVCGRVYHTRRLHTKYCSTACSQYAYRQRIKSTEEVAQC